MGLWGCLCNGNGGEGWGAEMGPENRDWVEVQIEGPLGYTRVVTYIVQEERIQNSCRVRRESLGAVCIGCVVPLWSGGPNGAGRRGGADKSGGKQGLCLTI